MGVSRCAGTLYDCFFGFGRRGRAVLGLACRTGGWGGMVCCLGRKGVLLGYGRLCCSGEYYLHTEADRRGG